MGDQPEHAEREDRRRKGRRRKSDATQQIEAERDAYVAGRDQYNVTLDGADAVAAFGQLLRSPSGPLSQAPGLLPRDIPGFTGRDEELASLSALAAGGRVIVTAIGGTAGVGKTALAVHAAHRLLPQFPDGQLYADLRGYTPGQQPAEPAEVLDLFLRHFGIPPEEIPSGLEERSGLLRSLLSARRVLMLLDNAATETQIRPLLPGAGNSLVLVTSRSLLPGLEADDRISLDVLPAADAVAFLTGLIGAARASAEPDVVGRVCQQCGNLPLALRIAGQLLATHRGWRVADLAARLMNEQSRLANLTAGDLAVRAAFAVSYQQLTKRDARLFRLLGLHFAPDISLASVAALSGGGPDGTRAALTRLVDACLLVQDTTGSYRMHDLLRLFARSSAEATDTESFRDTATARLVAYYANLAAFLDSCIDPEQRQAAQRAGQTVPEQRQALAIVQAERSGFLAAVSAAAARGHDDVVIHLSEGTGYAFTLLRYLDDARTIREAAVAAARRAGDAAAEDRALNNLGNVYAVLRRYDDAAGCFEGSLAIKRETGNREGEAGTLANLGNVYAESGRLVDAIGYFEESLAIRRDLRDLFGEAQTLHNLGNVYAQSRRFDDAVACFEQALAICQETGNRRDEAQALDSLGTVYHELNRFADAVKCYAASLTITRELSDRYVEGHTLGNLGSAYMAMLRPKQSAECWREAAAAMGEVGEQEQAAIFAELAAKAERGGRWFRR